LSAVGKVLKIKRQHFPHHKTYKISKTRTRLARNAANVLQVRRKTLFIISLLDGDLKSFFFSAGQQHAYLSHGKQLPLMRYSIYIYDDII
jgi:hypothetical protein